MNKKYNFIVYIGRFSPMHLGHENTIKTALKLSDKVILCLGSSNIPPTIKNPFSFKEREEMITTCFSDEVEQNRLIFIPIEDKLYQHKEWVKTVQVNVQAVVQNFYSGTYGSAKIALIGSNKDESSFYINDFSNWEKIEMDTFIKERAGNGVPLSSTKIRELLFTNHLSFTESILPVPIFNYMEKFTTTDKFNNLKEEYKFHIDYEKKWQHFPYAVNFLCVDAIVIQSGHLLMVQRGDRPGKGQWALPGGHVESTETTLEAVIRELKEETDLSVPTKVLLGSIKSQQNFDHPERSLRGRITTKKCRTFTVAYCFVLDDNQPRPHVKAGDDAAKAWWFPISEIENMKDQIFEDHASIIDYFISRV